MAGKSNY